MTTSSKTPMSSQHYWKLCEQITDVLRAHGVVELGADNTIASKVLAAIEWDHTIMSWEEFDGVRKMAEGVEVMMSIVDQWGWLGE